mmetsp:Transcript_42389/g.48715  ORF Transcript_42389/g.48715 Transcript_42389/m.48715 type:complete len:168 (+) Transcript_42389:209-712(+)
MEAFPNAKVILTERDPKKWYLSVKNSILYWYLEAHKWPMSLVNSSRVTQFRDMFHKGADGLPHEKDGVFGSTQVSKEKAIKFYEEWNAEVKRTVPKERLFVFRVQEGWEPLCKFLDVPVPNEPFPNANAGGTIKKVVRIQKAKAWAMVLSVPLMVGGVAYAAWKWFS